MVRKLYGEDEKLRILAIASVRGIPHAAKTFGVNRETISIWQAERGDDDKFQLAADLALSELTLEIAEGRGRAGLATKAGILADKAARYAKPKHPVEPKTPAEAWADEIEAKILELDPAERYDVSWYLMAILDEHRLHGDVPDQGCVVADFDHVAFLEGLGDPEEYVRRRRAEDREAVTAQLEANRQTAEAARMAALDDETRQLLESAERYLQENAR